MRTSLGLLLFLAVMGCSVPITFHGLHFEGQAEAVDTEEGPGVHAWITVRNPADGVETLSTGRWCPFEFRLLDEGDREVWSDFDAGRCLADVAWEIRLAPGETEELSRTLPVREVLDSGIEPGEYTVTAYIADPDVTLDLGRFEFRD